MILALLLVACKDVDTKSEAGLISTFGDQPSIAKGQNSDIAVVFGNEESIYFSVSNDDGKSFSAPELVGTLDGLVLGFSSGPSVAITNSNVVVTAPSRSGNIFSWTKPIDSKSWEGPFQINDVDASVKECLMAITSTPSGRLFSTWIDTRVMKKSMKENHDGSKKKPEGQHKKQKEELDLNKMTPKGISYKELFDKIGEVPENAKLAFHGDSDDNILWVFLDNDGNAIKAENLEEFEKFKEKNKNHAKIEGKIYLSFSDDEGKTWSQSKLVYKSPGGSVCECCKPSISSDSEGQVYIMFRNNVTGSRDLHLTKSIDNGATFSLAEKMGTGTWKINGCPMDGGGIAIHDNGTFNTVWQRDGEIFLANSNTNEQRLGFGRSPSISSNSKNTSIVYTNGENIMTTNSKLATPEKIGTGSFPKVISTNNSAIYFWVSEAGIQYKRI